MNEEKWQESMWGQNNNDDWKIRRNVLETNKGKKRGRQGDGDKQEVRKLKKEGRC
jgi:hypothetical protein